MIWRQVHIPKILQPSYVHVETVGANSVSLVVATGYHDLVSVAFIQNTERLYQDFAIKPRAKLRHPAAHVWIFSDVTEAQIDLVPQSTGCFWTETTDT